MEALGMLNALIGLVLVYFVLSLIASAITEWDTQLRGFVLAQVTVHAFFEHPQVQALQQDSTRKPSYIPTGSKTLRREMALRVQDHSISGYSQILANTHVVGG
ncbi:hypothetical protein [Dechloromonas denitrificans]|uniref:hypothetical protein n=1 Tax=Dechloromonas denitrificans TaxID=281362 RepID=UPI001CF7F232|nr:hypothetical protein [Dechloromonas denitrificans]UCV05680.1 hypothetical protein KI611_10685 [Dechloromonas denitrificans]